MDIKDYLIENGITPNLRGFRYLIEAVNFCIDHFNHKKEYPAVVNVIYPAVAELFNTTPSKVERGIRYIIELLPRSLFNGRRLTNSGVIFYFAYLNSENKRRKKC